jgi:hypothetical protein
MITARLTELLENWHAQMYTHYRDVIRGRCCFIDKISTATTQLPAAAWSRNTFSDKLYATLTREQSPPTAESLLPKLNRHAIDNFNFRPVLRSTKRTTAQRKTANSRNPIQLAVSDLS